MSTKERSQTRPKRNLGLITQGMTLMAVGYFGGLLFPSLMVQIFSGLFQLVGFMVMLRGFGMWWSRKEKRRNNSLVDESETGLIALE